MKLNKNCCILPVFNFLNKISNRKMMENFKLGDRVRVIGKNAKGEVAFAGSTHFSDGLWLGIFLDKPKGRNNGTVEGIRYFKCPRNHGIFVRSCQIEKECEDTHNNDKTFNQTSRRITYPNYLKSSSRIKSEKHHLCEAKVSDRSVDGQKAKSQPKSIDSPCLDITNAGDRSSDLQAIKLENEELKKKLEASEQSLLETTKKYTRAMDDMKYLKQELECVKKQIEVQKCNIKMLKMMKCNHYEDCVEIPEKKSAQISNNKSTVDTQSNMASEGLNISTNEGDPINAVLFTSMRRILELEDQNRVLIQGLFELSEFLKFDTKPQTLRIDKMNAETRPNFKKWDSPTCGSNSLASRSKPNQFPVERLEPESNEFGDILRKMTQFNKIVHGNERQERETTNSMKTNITDDFGSNKKEHLAVAVDNFPFRHPVINHRDTDAYTLMENIGVGKELHQNLKFLNRDNFGNTFQFPGDQRNGNLPIVPDEMKIKINSSDIGDMGSANEPDSNEKLRNLMSFMAASSANVIQTNDCNAQQQDSTSEVNDFASVASSFKSEAPSEYQLALSCNSAEMLNGSIGYN